MKWHHTEFENLIEIIKDKKIKTQDWVSFTSDKFLWQRPMLFFTHCDVALGFESLELEEVVYTKEWLDSCSYEKIEYLLRHKAYTDEQYDLFLSYKEEEEFLHKGSIDLRKHSFTIKLTSTKDDLEEILEILEANEFDFTVENIKVDNDFDKWYNIHVEKKG